MLMIGSTKHRKGPQRTSETPQRTPETSQKDSKEAPKHRNVCCWPGSSAFTIEMLHIRNSTIFLGKTAQFELPQKPMKLDKTD